MDVYIIGFAGAGIFLLTPEDPTHVLMPIDSNSTSISVEITQDYPDGLLLQKVSPIEICEIAAFPIEKEGATHNSEFQENLAVVVEESEIHREENPPDP